MEECRLPAAVIYLADHGEDIYDDARHRFLHASPTPTYWQIHVPMLMWMSEEYRRAHPDKEVTFFDERLTSVIAHRTMLDSGIGRMARRDKALVDRISATIILQGYMERMQTNL